MVLWGLHDNQEITVTIQDMKQAALQFKQLLADAAGRKATWTLADGREYTAELPAGLSYRVSGLKDGVNVTVGVAPGGVFDTFHSEEEVFDEVESLRAIWKGGLPGETKFGLFVDGPVVTSTRFRSAPDGQ